MTGPLQSDVAGTGRARTGRMPRTRRALYVGGHQKQQHPMHGGRESQRVA